MLLYSDNEKVELDWSTTSNSNVKKIVSKLPDIRFSDFASYPESLKTYANDVLDHKVAQTDMTIRHIASQSIVVSTYWYISKCMYPSHVTVLWLKAIGMYHAWASLIPAQRFTPMLSSHLNDMSEDGACVH